MLTPSRLVLLLSTLAMTQLMADSIKEDAAVSGRYEYKTEFWGAEKLRDNKVGWAADMVGQANLSDELKSERFHWSADTKWLWTEDQKIHRVIITVPDDVGDFCAVPIAVKIFALKPQGNPTVSEDFDEVCSAGIIPNESNEEARYSGGKSIAFEFDSVEVRALRIVCGHPSSWCRVSEIDFE